MTIVLQADARRAIIADFSVWAAENLKKRTPTAADSKAYFGYLQSDKRHLLEFRHPSLDKCEVVHSWLLSAGLLSD